jgi:hypothetical protein
MLSDCAIVVWKAAVPRLDNFDLILTPYTVGKCFALFRRAMGSALIEQVQASPSSLWDTPECPLANTSAAAQKPAHKIQCRPSLQERTHCTVVVSEPDRFSEAPF